MSTTCYLAKAANRHLLPMKFSSKACVPCALVWPYQIQIPSTSPVIQPSHQLALLNSIQIIINSSSISPPLKNNTLMRQIQHHIHSLSFVLMCDCFKHYTNFSWSDHQHPMLYYTKGYTNQLKLCPTTDDYPQADSPPQPAQGPRSSKGAGGSNPKPLTKSPTKLPGTLIPILLSLPHSHINHFPNDGYTSIFTTEFQKLSEWTNFPGFHTRLQPNCRLDNFPSTY